MGPYAQPGRQRVEAVTEITGYARPDGKFGIRNHVLVLVGQGGTVILGENTEMIGTTHMLARRAKTEQVAGQITDMVGRSERLTHEIMGDMASRVISPGNMDGGMRTIAEKALGSI